jgi:hypothetical protein
MLSRADVERIMENMLMELKIVVHRGDFIDPNSRKIELMLGDRVISSNYFDVAQQPEYEG